MPRMPHIITPKEFTRRDLLRLASITIGCGALSKAADAAVLGARGVAMGGGAGGLSAKSYVQDGLVAMWDGIENAGWGTHSDSLSAWVDLTGGSSAAFVGTPTVNADNVYFDSSSYATTAGRSGVVSIEIVVDIPQNIVFAAFGCGVRASSPGFSSFGSSNFSVYGWGYNGHYYASGYYNGRKGKHTHTYVASVSDYADGVNVHTKSRYPSVGYGTICIARSCADGAYYNGNCSIHCVRLYNRALSASEIAANYAVDAARFGIVV